MFLLCHLYITIISSHIPPDEFDEYMRLFSPRAGHTPFQRESHNVVIGEVITMSPCILSLRDSIRHQS